jgi:hypothetical protein
MRNERLKKKNQRLEDQRKRHHEYLLKIQQSRQEELEMSKAARENNNE